MRGVGVLVASSAFCLAVAALHSTWGQVGLPWPGPGTPAGGGGGGYQGPGDILSGAIGWWGFRAYNAAAATSNLAAFQAQSAHNGSVTCDVPLASAGGAGNFGVTTNCSTGTFNGQALNVFCNSNSDCTAHIIYDQSGNGRNMGASGTGCTISISPVKLICVTGQEYVTAGTVSVTQPATTSFVAQRTGSTSNYAAVIAWDPGATQSGFANSSGNLLLFAGTVVTVAYTEGTQGSVQETYDGANSVVDFNGTSSTGLNPGAGSATAAVMGLTGGGNTSGHDLPGNFWEAGIWVGTAANHTNFPYASMTSNQRSATNGWNF